MSLNEYATAEYALRYLAKADSIPHRTEGEAMVLDMVPVGARRILDLGTGDGRLLDLLLIDRPEAEGIGLDFSQVMLEAATARFSDRDKVRILEHDLDLPLPDLGEFDAIVSSFAIHHCEDERKRSIYREIHDRLAPGGVFCNLEHVASATPRLQQRFLTAMGITEGTGDPSNRLAGVETQLEWLRQIGFEDVDCYWKWLELAVIGGRRSDHE